MPSFYNFLLTEKIQKGSFALSRLPFSDSCTCYYQASPPSEFYNLNSLNGKKGFIFAPFIASKKYPILLFEDAISKKITLPPSGEKILLKDFENKDIDISYTKAFNTFYNALQNNLFDKLVLARYVDIKTSHINLESIFLEACKQYPQQHIILVSTPQSGIWLMATPEILLDKINGNIWHTIALAGTMHKDKCNIKWSNKNKEEHNYVVKYILNCLQQYSNSINVSEPFTTFASNLAHLRTDFQFTLTNENNIGNLLSTFHPTPAVCGIPKEAAKDFILSNEGIDRSYYSGFIGPLNINNETHLYVSLRCMQIMDNCCRLYAGGGLLSESKKESEWQETEAKLQTMLQLLQQT